MQLRREEFRFVRIRKGTKKPIGQRWQKDNNYRWDDPIFQKHLEDGGSYGVVCDFGNLVIVDADRHEVSKASEGSLPQTFTIQSGSRTFPSHFYFICKDLDKKIILNDAADGNHYGEVLARGNCAIGPGSLHENGKQYKVVNDAPIAEVSAEQIRFALRDFLKTKVVSAIEEEKKITKRHDIKLSITDVVPLAGLVRHGEELQGGHPGHGSDTGANFCINTSKNVWHCFRHDSGGGPLLWIAVAEGIIDCADAQTGALRGDVFKRVLEVAQEKYGLKLPEKQEERENNIIETCFSDIDGLLLQQVVGGKFAIYDGNSVSYATEYKAKNGKIYKPLNGKEIELGAILLAEKYEEPPITIKELIEEIVRISKKYVDMPEEMRKFGALFSVFTWLVDKSPVTPYFRFLGDFGTGKSRGKDVFGSFCYNYISASGAATSAPVFRIIEKWKPTLGFEESDWKDSDETNDLIKIINCGFEKGKFVMRCDKDDPSKIEFFDPFGPKIFASRKPFDDLATESRCLTIEMEESGNPPPLLPTTFWTEEASSVRNKLLGFRLKNWRTLEIPSNPDLPDIEPRLKQLATPLLPLFQNEVDKEDFFSFLKRYQEKIRAERANSFTGRVLQALMDLAETESVVICKNIATELNCSIKTISKELKALRMATEPRHIYIDQVDGSKKKKNFRAIVCDEKQWEKLMSRYFCLEERKIIPFMLKPQVTVSGVASVSGVAKQAAGQTKLEEMGTQDTQDTQDTGRAILGKIKCIFIQDLSAQIVGEDMKNYGPFNTGVITELPPKLAEVLIQQNIARAKPVI